LVDALKALGAEISKVDLTEANLNEATLFDTDLDGTIMPDHT